MQTQLKLDTVSSTQSQQINSYVLDTLGNNYNRPQCVDQLNCRNIYSKNEVDTESKLFGLGQQLNKLPVKMVDPPVLNKNVEVPKETRENIYWNNFNQNTRIQKSCDVLSGINIDRFDVIPNDLQTPHVNFQMKPTDSRQLHKYSNN